ncbi:MAG: sugar phosphate isomerase/epimerase [Verrucomicrobia bacterium]|nr:sugar phosphate isomerase/epimerase [Verrucomicrobiota bacterium]
MTTSRRKFLALSSLGTAAAALPASVLQAAPAPVPTPKAVLRLSCQEGVAPGKSLTEKLDFLEANGFDAIEPGGRGLPDRVAEFQKALQGRKLKVSAVCAGFQGVLISDSEPERKKAMETIKEVLTAAGALGSVGMIVVPAFNNQTKLGHQESRELLVKLLPELGEHAQQAGTRILLEPLNRAECHFLRQLADAAAICRDAKHPGVGMMGDFWHMTWEETSDYAAFIAAGKYLQHVHCASRKDRKLPGEDEGDNYVDGMKGLKYIGYQNYISLECGCKGDRLQAVPAAAKLLREQWELA